MGFFFIISCSKDFFLLIYNFYYMILTSYIIGLNLILSLCIILYFSISIFHEISLDFLIWERR